MKFVRVIVVHPLAAPSVEMLEDSAEALQGAVGGYFEVHRIVASIPGYPGMGERAALYCNEDGRSRDLPVNRYVAHLDDWIRGTFVLASSAVSPTGEMVSFTDEQIARLLPLVEAWPQDAAKIE